MSDPRQQGPAYRNRNGPTIWGSIAVIAAILIIGGLFYSYKSNNTKLASNNPPAASMDAPAPVTPRMTPPTASPLAPTMPAAAPTQH